MNPLTFPNKEQFLLDTLGMAVGETLNNKMPCPMCTKADSFSVTRVIDGILFNCFRAKCGAHGFIPSLALQGMEQDGKEVKKGIVSYLPAPTHTKKNTNVLGFSIDKYKEEYKTRKLTSKEIVGLTAKYRLNAPQIHAAGYQVVKETGQLYIPLYNFIGEQWGFHTRKESVINDDFKGPKAVSHWDNGQCPSMHFPKDMPTKECLYIAVVEDVISAERLAPLMPVVSIMGTALTQYKVTYINQFFDQVLIAFDADATDKAIEYKKEYNAVFRNFWIAKLSKDPKYLTGEEVFQEIICSGD